MLTDCMDVKAGLVRMDEERMEYKLLDAILSDDMAHAALKMGVRNPVTPEELAKKLRWSTEKTQAILDEMAQLGIVEYNRHNDDRHKQYVLPIFVVGSAENIMLNKELVRKLGSLAPRFFYEMSLEPLKLISGMVPPGGAGLGFHVIPVERAIPKESQAVDIERLSYWLKKYEGHYAIQDCVCRKTMIALGQGCGELPEGSCISLGDYSDYLVETGKANRASYEEILAVLRQTEENGYMHQITNGDGGDEIFSICNCSVGNCFALRCSQYFNARISPLPAIVQSLTRKNALHAASAQRYVPQERLNSVSGCAQKTGRWSIRVRTFLPELCSGERRSGTRTTGMTIAAAAIPPALPPAKQPAPHTYRFKV